MLSNEQIIQEIEQTTKAKFWSAKQSSGEVSDKSIKYVCMYAFKKSFL